jgi:acyl-CoA thioester hydrolase
MLGPDVLFLRFSAMPAVFQYQLTVPEEAIDGQGHVNNLEYVRWMQEAAVAHSTAQGWSAQRYTETGGGWVVRSHRIEYRQPAFAGDQVVVFTWVADFRKIRSLRKYKIVRPLDETVLAIAETDWAFIGTEHRVPRRIPPELSSAFVIVPEEDAP